jgi:hypothetical protein
VPTIPTIPHMTSSFRFAALAQLLGEMEPALGMGT